MSLLGCLSKLKWHLLFFVINMAILEEKYCHKIFCISQRKGIYLLKLIELLNYL